MHVPLPEFAYMYNETKTGGNKITITGCSYSNAEPFNAFKNSEKIEAIFSGHDHQNDYWGEYKGIKLFYGRKSSSAFYSDPDI